MADKRISQLIERTDIANNDVLPIVASGATTTNKVTVSTLQDWMQDNLDVGVTSVGLSVPSAFTVSGSPVTTSGNITISGAGTTAQYIRGDGSLADFPSSLGGGGASVSYYLNGSVSQGTIGGVAYRELSKSPILGAGTDFTINADGYIASFITDAGDPSLLEIPGGNWNFETYFQASSGGGSPTFYVELYKVSSGGTATLIATSSGSPELIAFGTNITPYFSSLAVPTTTLALTDRLAIRYYVVHAGRTITLHTENNTLCQIITTFTTGLTALNGLTAQVQNFATGTSGTDFNISSASTTHTFNLPTASSTNRGALSSADWSTFNGKQNAITLTTTGSSGAATLVGSTLNIPNYTNALSDYVPYTGATQSVDLGVHQLNAGSARINGASPTGGSFLGFKHSTSVTTGTNGYTSMYTFGTNNIGFQSISGATQKDFSFSMVGITPGVPGGRVYNLPDASGTLALTSNLSAYLPLTGGTLTGALGGTSLNFSGDIQTATRLISATGGQQILINANNGGSTNRVESVGTLPLALVSAAAITMAAGGTTPQITLATTGNVGIGTSSPSVASGLGLVLNGGAAQTRLAFKNTFTGDSSGDGVQFALINGSSGFVFQNRESDGYFSFETNGTERLNIASTGAATFSSSVTAANHFSTGGSTFATSSGQVGIGTSSFAGDELLMVSMNGTTNTQAINVKDRNASASSSTYMVFRKSDDTFQGNIRRSGTDNALYVGGNEYISFGTGGNTPHMRINSSGNVGIGTASPSEKLDVRGGALINGDLRLDLGDLNAPKTLFFNTNSTTGGSYGNIKWYNVQWDGLTRAELVVEGDGALANGRMVFKTGSSGSNATERMRITSDAYLRMASGSNGIQFNGDTAAANALDDYEEGTWTPAFIGGGGNASYNSRRGWYTKIGRQVTIVWEVSFQKNTISSTMGMSGLPFTVLADSSAFYPQGTVLLDNLSTTTNNITFQVANGSTQGDFIGGNGGTTSHTGLPASSLGSGTMMCRGSATYYV
jgi:hypothetical protein